MLVARFIGGEEVIRKLDAMNPKIHQSLLVAITRLSIKLQSKVISQKLSGQVLKTRTGTLRRSITQRVIDKKTSITGRVGTNVDYGLMHEFGFRGVVGVRSHLRKVKSVFGKPLKSPIMVNVSAHSRNVNFPERSFLRSALREMLPEIQKSIDEAIRV